MNIEEVKRLSNEKLLKLYYDLVIGYENPCLTSREVQELLDLYSNISTDEVAEIIIKRMGGTSWLKNPKPRKKKKSIKNVGNKKELTILSVVRDIFKIIDDPSIPQDDKDMAIITLREVFLDP